MKVIIVAIACLVLSGCYRNSPEQQVADAKVCIDGGMTPRLTAFLEIWCDP